MKMKRALIASLLACSTLAVSAQTKIHVSPTASKGGKGTLESPYNTIEAAKQRVSKINKKMSEDIVVYLHGGTHTIDSPLIFKEKDSGMNGHSIIYKAYDNQKPVISGGVSVSGWERVDNSPIYKATLNRDMKLRTLFVNGKRARMAGSEVPIYGQGEWGKYIVKGDEPWAIDGGEGVDGIKFLSKDVRNYNNPEDVELVQNNVWTEKIICIRDVEQVGDTTILKLQQPFGAIASNMAWAGKIQYKKRFIVRNAFELLDSPGEFYFNKATNTLYYYSAGEDMSSAEVIAPTSDGFMLIEGSSQSSRVKNLSFEGITFAHDHWNLYEIEGSHAFTGVQSTAMGYKFLSGGNWHTVEYGCCDVSRGAIEIKSAENITFELKRFEGVSSASAINMVNDVVNSRVNGCFFNDLLGNAVNVGHPQHYKIGDGPLYPAGVEGVCENITVSNNYLRNVSLDFRQLEGLTAYFVSGVKFDHNDISNIAYGAMTIGWWWGNSKLPPSTVAKNNSMSFNRAGDTHLALKDGGIIYALGEQPGTVIEGNYLFGGQRSIYPDDGSAYLTIKGNMVRNARSNFWLHIWTGECHDIVVEDNYVKSNDIKQNGTNVTIKNTRSFPTTNTFSAEANAIIEAAGVQEKYKKIIPAKRIKQIELYPKDFKDTDH